MDLVSLAVGLQQAKTIGDVQILVARKILDAEQQQGDAAIKLIDAAESGVNSAAIHLLPPRAWAGSSTSRRDRFYPFGRASRRARSAPSRYPIQSQSFT